MDITGDENCGESHSYPYNIVYFSFAYIERIGEPGMRLEKRFSKRNIIPQYCVTR